MAMSHTLLLFVSLLFLPVLLGSLIVSFKKCDNIGSDYGDLVNMFASPDLNYNTVLLAVTGVTSKTIPGESFVHLTGRDEESIALYRLCDMAVVGTCNTKGEIEAGGGFGLHLDGVRLYHDKDVTYNISLISDINKEPQTIYMCANFKLDEDIIPLTLVSA